MLRVKKENESGLFSNDRLLFFKSGFVSYYSKQPKGFDGSLRSIELSGELPKYTLCVKNIKTMRVNEAIVEFEFY